MLEGVVALLAGTLSDQEQGSPADMWRTYNVRRKYI